MLLGQVFGGLHLDQPRGGAAEIESAIARGIEPVGQIIGGDDEMAAMLVELVDQHDEAPRLVALVGREPRHAVEDERVEMPGNGQEVGRAQRRAAELVEAGIGDALGRPRELEAPRVLSAADLLVLVAPASPDAATSLANTQQWLGAHGHGELAGRAVTVVNGVSRRTRDDVLRAESVARGRCRAIVRVPWDDLLSSHPGTQRQTTLQPQTRLAYTALAGVLVTGLAAAAPSPSLGPVPERNPGEHAD